MSKEFTKSYAINRIAELNEQIVEMTAEQSETMRYLNKLRDNNKQLKQQLEEKDKEIELLKHLGKHETTVEMFKENAKLIIEKRQFAISELEKVKASAEKWFEFWEYSKYEGKIYDKLDVSNAYLQMSCEIDQQIKKLMKMYAKAEIYFNGQEFVVDKLDKGE